MWSCLASCDIQVDGRTQDDVKKLTENDCSEWKLTTVDPQERNTWRSGVKSAMPAASQLPGRGPLMWMMPKNPMMLIQEIHTYIIMQWILRKNVKGFAYL